jgi:hypothetical protein
VGVQESPHNTEGLPLFSRGAVRASWYFSYLGRPGATYIAYGTAWRSGGPSEGPWALRQRSVRGSGRRGPGRRHTGEPPQMGTSGSQRRGFRRTRAGAGGVPAVWGVGAAFWCPKWPVPLSRLFGGGLESHINPLKSVGTASGWCGVGNHHVPAKCARGYPRKRPGSNPNPKSGSEIAIDTRSWGCRC